MTAATAGSIALSGAVLDITASYVILAAGFVDDRRTPASVPAVELAVILLGFPVAAALGAWLAPNRTDEALARPMLDCQRLRSRLVEQCKLHRARVRRSGSVERLDGRPRDAQHTLRNDRCETMPQTYCVLETENR